tara:strand:- start:10230 stop:10991 length:762 start_codon:yes stop_codon:yes gene_type:complete
MKKRVPLVVGNWKLNPVKLDDATKLAKEVARKNREVDDVDIAVAPPFVYVEEVGKKIAKGTVALAAQDAHYDNIGAYTGEVSVPQLKDLGVVFVIVGHSERRAMGEVDDVVRRKAQAVLKQRLTPIVCIGERERDEHGLFFNFVEQQIRSLGEVLSATEIKKVVIAYEPIWAIGTGDTATSEDVKEMQLFIETVLTKVYDRTTARKVQLIYGGSVKPGNVKELHEEGGMSGFLVGGASLKAADFTEIIKAALD